MLENVSFQTFLAPCTVGDTDVVCIEPVELVVVVDDPLNVVVAAKVEVVVVVASVVVVVDDPLNAVVAAKVEVVVVVASVVLIVDISQGLFATAT